MKQWPHRFAETIQKDDTKLSQLFGSLAAFGAAYWLAFFDTPTDPQTARAVFYFLSSGWLAVILFGSALLQIIAAFGPHRTLKLVAGSIKTAIWVYVSACFWLTNPHASSVPFIMTFALAE